MENGQDIGVQDSGRSPHRREPFAGGGDHHKNRSDPDAGLDGNDGVAAAGSHGGRQSKN